MSEPSKEIRCLVCPIEGGKVLLPGSVVAEVANFEAPHSYKNSPAWLLGGLAWKDWNVPVMSFAMLAGTAQNEIPGPRTRILVVKSVNGSANTPYLGLLINGVPSMAKINSDSMTESDRKSDFSCVFREVKLNDSRVMIPDMAELNKTIQSVISEDGEEET